MGISLNPVAQTIGQIKQEVCDATDNETFRILAGPSLPGAAVDLVCGRSVFEQIPVLPKKIGEAISSELRARFFGDDASAYQAEKSEPKQETRMGASSSHYSDRPSEN